MAPLQEQCRGLQADNNRLQVERRLLEAQTKGLRGRMNALELVEEGGRRQRQRVGPAAHDAPPSNAAVAEMGLKEAVAALRAHVADARVAEEACRRVAKLCSEVGIIMLKQTEADAEAGAIEAVVEAMWAHPQELAVLVQGIEVLWRVCFYEDGHSDDEDDEDGEPTAEDRAACARARRVIRAGGRTLAAAAMQAFEQACWNVAFVGCRDVPVQDCGPMVAQMLRAFTAAPPQWRGEVHNCKTMAQDVVGWLDARSWDE